MMRIPYQELYDVLLRVLRKVGFESERGELCARLFTGASCDGVYTHGLNRLPRFIKMIESGMVDIHAEPDLVASFGAIERWNGKRGPGNLNAYACMERAISLSKEHGVGAVALANTNHWMRGGSYGWQAADAGVIGVCWTNTMPNMPPWGASEARVGNNPLVLAVPRAEGHIVLDMAMSQFSYGTLEAYRRRGEQLPVSGGFDLDGELTTDAGAIEKSARPLPIGYWKGSGLALMLDLLAALLSGGLATYQIPQDSFKEVGLSQVFIAFDLPSIDRSELSHRVVNEVIDFVHGASLSEGVRYPGERTLEIRKENMEKGIPIEPIVWEQIRQM